MWPLSGWSLIVEESLLSLKAFRFSRWKQTSFGSTNLHEHWMTFRQKYLTKAARNDKTHFLCLDFTFKLHLSGYHTGLIHPLRLGFTFNRSSFRLPHRAVSPRATDVISSSLNFTFKLLFQATRLWADPLQAFGFSFTCKWDFCISF